MVPIAQAAAITTLALGTGAAAVTALNKDIPDLEVPEKEWVQEPVLDGLVFFTTDTVVETGEILTDELLFQNGTFQSKMCQVYCDFGWSPYHTWTDGKTTYFTVTTKCPDAPHTIVWYGSVTNDEVAFKGTWTTRRWYWTKQISVTGEGSTTPPLDLDS